MQVSASHTPPQLGLFASLRRLLFGDRAKRAHISNHGAFMRTLGPPAEMRGSLDDPWTFLDHIAEVWGYVVGQAPCIDGDGATTDCAMPSSHVDVAWIRRVAPDADTNRSRWPTDPIWQLVQAAPFTDAPTYARRLMRHEQHVHAVELLDAGAYGYLVSRTALLHPKGDTFDVSMGLRGLFDALTKVAAQPGKDFGEHVRQRRRKRGLPVAPAGKVLPLPPAQRADDRGQLHAVNKAELVALQQDLPSNVLRAAHTQLAEARLAEALHALEDASLRGARASTLYGWNKHMSTS
jgi:hypothetical protein